MNDIHEFHKCPNCGRKPLRGSFSSRCYDFGLPTEFKEDVDERKNWIYFICQECLDKDKDSENEIDSCFVFFKGLVFSWRSKTRLWIKIRPKYKEGFLFR